MFKSLLIGFLLIHVCLGMVPFGTDDEVAVPHRGWVPRNCVHQVPEDSLIRRLPSGDFLVTHPAGEYVVEALHDECPAKPAASASPAASPSDALIAPYQGWNAYVSDIQVQTYTKFYGTWNVPAAPVSPDTSSVIFFFTGLQDTATTSNPTIDIIQPVLQFGDNSAAGGCLCWAIASWYVPTSGRSFVSPLKRVSVGASIFGNMTRTSSDCWTITTSTGSTSTPLSLCQSVLISQPQAYVTEEAYAKSCADYPPASTSCLFQELALWGPSGNPVTPNWRISTNSPNCGSVVTVASSTEIKFSW